MADVGDGAPELLRAEKLPEADETGNLRGSATRGVAWQFLGAAWQTLVQLGVSAVLARVLFPRDFGLLGMAVLTQGMVRRMGDFSAAAGIVAKKDITHADLSTAFWMSWAVQGALFVVTFSIAPWAARFFETPEVTWIIRAIAVTFFFTAAASTHATLLRRRLMFGTLNVIDGAAFAFQSGLAVLLAVVFGMNYWALVIAILAGGFAESVATILCTGWLPSFLFDKASFRYLFRFGINGLGASLVTYFHNNTDYLFVGKLLGPSTLGLYEFAYRIPHMAYNRVAIPLAEVMFPALSRAQTSNERLAAGYLKAVQYIAIVLFPALGGLAAVARPAVAVIWGEKWLAVVLPLQVLCLRSAVLSAISPSHAIFLCRNRPDIPLKYSVYTLLLTLSAVAGLGWVWGLVGVAAGMLLSALPAGYLLWLASRMTGTPFRGVLQGIAPPAISAALSSLMALAVVQGTMGWCGSNLLALGLGISAGVVGYGSVMCLRYGDIVRDVLRTMHVALAPNRLSANPAK